MWGSVLLPFLFLYFAAGAENRELQPNVRQTVLQCDEQALWWDVVEDANAAVVFDLQFTALQSALWTVTVVKRAFNASSSTNIVDNANDCTSLKWTVLPTEANIVKRQEFVCGDFNGRWWIVVRHDAQVARDFMVGLTIRSMYFASSLINLSGILKNDPATLLTLTVGKTKDEAAIISVTGPDSVKFPLQRY
jgi:hypothetical protein